MPIGKKHPQQNRASLQALKDPSWRRPVIGTTYCPNCEKTQEDRGVGCTCSYCGYSPLPSIAYPEDSVFKLGRFA